MARKPIVAGMFYEDNPKLLENQITGCFKSKFGPGELPSNRKDKKIIGIIAPHAGYQFSGPGQAIAYKEIAESEIPDVYIILGTTHTGFPAAATILEDFETPFGTVKVDKEFAIELINQNLLIENKPAHQDEHSIEVQLPFLQFINKEAKIVPIVVGEKAHYERLGKAIVKTAKEQKKKIILICSSDFTHYGYSYGFILFNKNVKEHLKEFDLNAIKWIKRLDSKNFLKYVNETGATICGVYAITVFIEACKELNAKTARLEQYYTSGDVTGDYTNAVGYASIIVE
jgi:hypothetical protein